MTWTEIRMGLKVRVQLALVLVIQCQEEIYVPRVTT